MKSLNNKRPILLSFLRFFFERFLVPIWLLSLVFFGDFVIKIMIAVFGLVCFALIGALISDSTNHWLTNKEQEELRSIDINLLAAEENLEFSEDDKLLSRKITNSLKILSDPKVKVINLIHELGETGRILIFEHLSKQFHTQSQSLENSDERLLTGVGVLFEYQFVPQFILIHQSISNKVQLNRHMIGFTHSKLETKNYPDWLSASEYLCFYRGAPNQTTNFLMLNRPFSFVTDESSVRLISFQGDMVVAFFEQEIRADGSNLDQFKRFGQRMLELQGDEVEPGEKAPDSL